MVRCWIFSSRNKENIRRASERLLWGFWDKELVKGTKSKLVRNWRQFLRLYNNIYSGDIVFFQIVRTGEIHAIGIVKDRYYDDQTPVWDLELKNNKVLFPWRVSFYFMVYSEEPLAHLFAEIKNYIDGYGIGEISFHEAKELLNKLEGKYHLVVNVSFT